MNNKLKKLIPFSLGEYLKDTNIKIVTRIGENVKIIRTDRDNTDLKNLAVEVCHPEHNVGYYHIVKEPDEHNITVKIKLLGRTICEGTSCS
jgi:hypothetical protein